MTLPVLEWEVPECRVVVPELLQRELEIVTPVLRWSRQKRERVLVEHADAVPVISMIETYLAAAEWAGQQSDNPKTWIVMVVYDGHWFQVVIGDDKSGRTNMVTVHQLRPEQVAARMEQPWMRQRQRK